MPTYCFQRVAKSEDLTRRQQVHFRSMGIKTEGTLRTSKYYTEEELEEMIVKKIRQGKKKPGFWYVRVFDGRNIESFKFDLRYVNWWS